LTVQLRLLGSEIFEFSDSSVLSFEVERERLGFNIRDRYRKSVLLFFSRRFGRHQAMDAIIRQAVREEISRQNRNERNQTAAASYIYVTTNSSLRSTSVIRQSVRDEISRQDNKEPEKSAASSANAWKSATYSSIQRSTVSRLSGPLDRIRGQQKGKKRKIDNEHRIQIRWIHYGEKSQAFIRQKNAGGNRFASYSSSEAPTVEELKNKATALSFPDGKSPFSGQAHVMLLDVCNTTQTVIFEFLGDGTVDSYLKERGLYPSTTYLYLRLQHKDTILSEAAEETVGLASHRTSGDSKRIVCSVCSCTYLEGQEYIRFEQDREYETSRIADGESMFHWRPTSSCYGSNKIKLHSSTLKSWYS